MTYTQPLLTIFLVITAAALVGVRDRRRKVVAAAGVCGLFLVSWPPVDWLFSRPLEARYAIRPFVAPPGLQALVVFSERVEPPHFERPYSLASENTWERCRYAAWIYRRYGPLPVVVSGGPVAAGFPASAPTMRDILIGNGVAEGMVWSEERSRSTHEKALYSAGILKQHGISRAALVVDATSMPRAAACLHKLGIEVVPSPCSYRQPGPLQEELLPSWRAIRQNEDTLHEVLGLIWYRLRGWI
jgi:uncharacterized SAM-binding protein YcdF (DUF218 family)